MIPTIGKVIKMLPIADMPPLEQQRIECSIEAAKEYGLPADLMLAFAEMEGGKPKLRVRNTNGTYDIGWMQFNTMYLKDLAKYNITEAHVASSDCFPFKLAAWRIRGHLINDKGDFWTRAANWHSRTPKYNAIYRNKLIPKTRKWGEWLAKFYKVKPL